MNAKYLTMTGQAQFRAWRMRREMTVQEMATRLGVQKSTVQCWETGRLRPNFDTAAYIEHSMGIPMRDWAKARTR